MTTTAPSLAEQITAAQQTEAPLHERVADLEFQLREAVEASDYATADHAQKELVPAREAWGVAKAATAALVAVQQEIARRNEADASSIRLAQQRDQARQIRDKAVADEQEAQAEADEILAKVRPAIAAVRELLQAASAAEQRAGQARQDSYSAMVTLGEREPGMRISASTNVRSLIERSPVLRAIWQGKETL